MARVAWTAWAVILLVGAISLVLRYLNGSTLTSSLEGADYFSEILLWDVLVPAAIPVYATVGALVASRRPRNAVGWLCLTLGMLVAAVEASWEYAARTFEAAPGSLPAALSVAWVSWIVNPITLVPFVLMLLLFPDGRLPSRRWRPLACAVAGGAALALFFKAFTPKIGAAYRRTWKTPRRFAALKASRYSCRRSGSRFWRSFCSR